MVTKQMSKFWSRFFVTVKAKKVGIAALRRIFLTQAVAEKQSQKCLYVWAAFLSIPFILESDKKGIERSFGYPIPCNFGLV